MPVDHSGEPAEASIGTERAARELAQREPLFHRVPAGSDRAVFEAIAAPEFWEVGASGRVYEREFVLATLEERHAHPEHLGDDDAGEVRDFECRRLADGLFLATYTLVDGERVTRRSTIWSHGSGAWRAVYHQGTVVAPGD